MGQWPGRAPNHSDQIQQVEAAWGAIGAVDPNTVEVSIGNDYSEASWSGTITVEYDISALGVTLASPPNGHAYQTGTPITATATCWIRSFDNTVTFHLTPVSPPGAPVTMVSPDINSPFGASFGTLANGTYDLCHHRQR